MFPTNFGRSPPGSPPPLPSPPVPPVPTGSPPLPPTPGPPPVSPTPPVPGTPPVPTSPPVPGLAPVPRPPVPPSFDDPSSPPAQARWKRAVRRATERRGDRLVMVENSRKKRELTGGAAAFGPATGGRRQRSHSHERRD